MLDAMQIVYLTESSDVPEAKRLRRGAAGCVLFDPDGGFALETRVDELARARRPAARRQERRDRERVHRRVHGVEGEVKEEGVFLVVFYEFNCVR